MKLIDELERLKSFLHGPLLDKRKLIMSHIEISATTTPNDDYHVRFDIYQKTSVMNLNIRMTKDELKELRDSIHNILIDFNIELNFE